MLKVEITAHNPSAVGKWRAGRFFPNEAKQVLTIVPDADVTKTDDRGNGPLDEVTGRPSMEVISESNYAMVKADPHLTKYEFDPDLQGSMRDLSESLREATAEIERLQMIAAGRAAESDGLKAQLLEAIDLNAALTKECDELKATIEAATEPAATPATTETPPDDDAKGRRSRK